MTGGKERDYRSMHFPDEELIAYLNGADGLWRRRTLKRHMASCLECRYRLSLLNEALNDMIAAASSWQETDLIEIERAKQIYRSRAAEETQQRLPSRRFRFSTVIRFKPSVIAGAVLIAMISIIGVWNFRTWKPNDPLVKSQAAEADLATHLAIRQEFELTISGPDGAASGPRKMEVVFDPKGQRLAVAWRNSDGSLVYGLWRPSPERALEFYSAENTGVRPLDVEGQQSFLLTKALSNGVPGLENALVCWLERRAVAPIHLAEEGIFVPSLARLGNPHSVHQGANLLLQWKVTATEEASTLSLSINGSNYRPLSQALRCQSASLEVKLTLVHETQLPPGSINPAVFEPSPMLIMAAGASPSPLPLVFGLFLFPGVHR